MSEYLHRPQNRMAACMSMPMGGVVPEEGTAPAMPEGTIITERPAQRLYRVGMVAAAVVAASATFAQGNANGGATFYQTSVCVGPNDPGSVVNDTSSGEVSWANPSSAAASDNAYATAQAPFSSNRATTYLKATDLGFAIPADATIDGVTVEIERKASESSSTRFVRDITVQLVLGGVVSGNNKALTATNWPAADAYQTYGGSGDRWGLTLTPAEVNASDFGVVLKAGLTTPDAAEVIASVDHIRVTVCHSVAVAPDDLPPGIGNRPILREPKRTVPYPSGVVLNAQVPPEEVQTANIAPLIVQPPRVAQRAPEGAYWISQPYPAEPVVDSFMPPGLIQVDNPKPFISPQPALSIPILQGGVVPQFFQPHGWQFNVKSADHALRILTTKHPYIRRSLVRLVGDGNNGLAANVVQVDWLNGTAVALVPDHIGPVHAEDTVFVVQAVDGTGHSDAPTFLVVAKISGPGDLISGDFCWT